MNSSERRKKVVELIASAKEPLSGSVIAKKLGVSRQVIVQDIALLKAEGVDILSTYKGYVISENGGCTRVFKVRHTEEQTEEELTGIVDLGGTVLDVYVWHRVYGRIEAKLNIQSRHNIKQFMEGLRSGKSTALMNVTSGYHYHTVKADSEETLDLIEKMLNDKNFIVPEI